MGNARLAKGLTNDQLHEIQELEKECSDYEELNMKLNWDMLETRAADEINDLLYYDDNRLIGFLGLYDIKKESKEIEITGMVHPDYRRQGVFKKLFSAAKQECLQRKVKRILLITERSSDTGKCFVKFTGSQYSFSEYRMKFAEATIPKYSDSGIKLRKAEESDYPELIHLDRLGFKDNSTYVAELDGEIMGKIGLLRDGKDGYVFGFVINPDYRRQGYGRDVLSKAVSKLLSEQINTVLLEVAVKNESALMLYKSCGFKEITVYDYYEIVL